MYKNKKMIYDNNLEAINIINLKSDKSFICNKLNNRLNLYLSKNNKVEIGKINFENYELLPPNWQKTEIKNNLTGYCFGQHKILNNNIFFYSENVKDNADYISLGFTKEVGIIIIENSNYYKNWIKVYESEIDSFYFLESFLFDNYIFLIQTNDSGYDVFYHSKEKKIKYKYLIYEILKDGIIAKVIESKAKKIKKKYLDK